MLSPSQRAIDLLGSQGLRNVRMLVPESRLDIRDSQLGHLGHDLRKLIGSKKRSCRTGAREAVDSHPSKRAMAACHRVELQNPRLLQNGCSPIRCFCICSSCLSYVRGVVPRNNDCRHVSLLCEIQTCNPDEKCTSGSELGQHTSLVKSEDDDSFPGLVRGALHPRLLGAVRRGYLPARHQLVTSVTRRALGRGRVSGLSCATAAGRMNESMGHLIESYRGATDQANRSSILPVRRRTGPTTIFTSWPSFVTSSKHNSWTSSGSSAGRCVSVSGPALGLPHRPQSSISPVIENPGSPLPTVPGAASSLRQSRR